MRTVSTPATFQACEFSYLGAIAGVLQARGVACDTADVGGYAGYSFLMKVTAGWTDPGSPSMHSGNVVEVPNTVQRLWADFRAGTATLGAHLESYWDTQQFAFWDTAQQAANEQRTHALFERVKHEIDQDRPAIVWGLVVPEYGIVNGYTDDSYLVSTFRRLLGQPDTPVRYDQLEAKGGLEAIFVPQTHAPPTEADDRAALRRALVMAEGSPYTFAFDTPKHPLGDHQRYVTGVAAYDTWASVLERAAPHTIYAEYLSYIAACVYETKQLAAHWLQRFAERYRHRPQAPPLAQAATAYQRAARELEQLVWLFPFDGQGEPSQDQCARGATYIRAAQPHEHTAITHLHDAVHRWAA